MGCSRRGFGQVRHARGELAAAVPRELAASIDWSTLRAEPAEFVDETCIGTRQRSPWTTSGTEGSPRLDELLS